MDKLSSADGLTKFKVCVFMCVCTHIHVFYSMCVCVCGYVDMYYVN